MNVAPIAIGRALPGTDLPGATLSNERLAQLMGDLRARLLSAGEPADFELCSPSFPEERVGVLERRVLDASLTTRDLAITAARKCLARARDRRGRIRAIVVTTVTSERVVPPIACSVQAALRLPEDLCAFDLSLGCNGFITGLDVAARLLEGQPDGSCALLISAEAMTRVLDAKDRTTCPIFGDGAAALLVESTREGRFTPAQHHTLGQRSEAIEITSLGPEEGAVQRITSVNGDLVVREDTGSRRCVRMQGRSVFRDMAGVLPERIEGYLAGQGLRLGEIDHVAFHQANRRLVEAVAHKRPLGLPPEKLLFNIDRLGNTTSASIPLLLAHAAEQGVLERDQRVLLVGFGTGYSVSMTVLNWTELE